MIPKIGPRIVDLDQNYGFISEKDENRLKTYTKNSHQKKCFIFVKEIFHTCFFFSFKAIDFKITYIPLQKGLRQR